LTIDDDSTTAGTDAGQQGKRSSELAIALTAFEPNQRELLLQELQEWREVVSESIRFSETEQGLNEPGPTGTLAEKHERLADVTEAIRRLEATDPADSPVLVGPASFVQEICRGGVIACSEKLGLAIHNWSSNPKADSRFKLQQAVYGVRLWTRSLLAAYEEETYKS
jgi:hypothetical protein